MSTGKKIGLWLVGFVVLILAFKWIVDRNSTPTSVITSDPINEVTSGAKKPENEDPSETTLSDEFEHVETKIPVLEYDGGEIATLPLPKTPFLDEGCEGEWCSNVKSLKLMRDVIVREDADEGSAVVESLKAGEKVKRARIYIKTLKTQNLPNKKGVVIHYGSEGMYIVVMSDRAIEAPMLPEKDIKDLKTEEWVYVQTQNDRFGWIRAGKPGDRAFESSK